MGIILIIVIGRAFYALAHEHYKNRWGIAVLGVLSYYLGTMVGGFLLGIILELTKPGSIQEYSNFVLSLMTIPFGFIASFIFYVILRKMWNNQPQLKENNILDQDL